MTKTFERIVSAICGLGLVISAADVILAQRPDTIRIVEKGSCKACKIILTQQAVLRPPESAPAFISPFQFGTSSRGQYYVVDPFGEIGIAVFARDGTYGGHIGKRGDGPGEFRFISTFTVGAGDSLHVFGANESVFDPSGKYVRTRSIPKLIRAKASFSFSDGRVFLLGNSGTERDFGIPFHVIMASGQLERSFGLQANAVVGANLWNFHTAVARGRGAYFWSAYANRYAIERWSNDGVLLSVYARDASWFEPWKEWDGRSDAFPPPTRLVSFYEDQGGVLWTLLLAKDANWKSSVISNTREVPYPTIDQQEARFDSIFEAFDIRTGDLLTSLRLPGMHVALFGEGLTAETFADAKGEIGVRIYKLSLVGKSK